ncbi:uncharacterized protein LOC124437489 [Xenia sp. Carnegie-2017]|uniref:uncharacterized protein LOC124437489 n=1 Tax=Xenia sp. Carnegie-2017 TaxID=2897299 RepID=UPI001F03DD98|nr:uncharacterized protein LOC124437489 [Xenia sp. Carnegie-2017]
MIVTILISSLYLFIQCKATSWPDGKYCLPMPRNGICPSRWRSGHRHHDMEDDTASDNHNWKTSGWVPKNSNLPNNLQWSFCCNANCSQRNHVNERILWPSGSYCIFRCGGSCPRNFHEGSIYWDDEDSRNNNKKSGMLPDGTYGRNTKIFFCCRHDPRLLTGLPKCSQMMLMRYKGICPQSGGYSRPKTGFLQWDTENKSNGDKLVGHFPDGEKTFNSGIKIEFCSYTSIGTC